MAKAQAAHGPGAVEQLAEWVLAPRAQDIPAAAITQAKLLLLDTIGCGYAAFEEDATHRRARRRSRTWAARRNAP